MTNANSQTEDQLVDILDDALLEIRRKKSIDCATWQQTHPEVGDEGLQLVQTLILLSSAADTWRVSDIRDIGVVEAPSLEVKRLIPRLIGRYQIRGLVGSGSMGDVFDGYDPQLERRVAVKIPRCDRLEQNREVFTERFIREARSAAAVRHENICPVYDTGKQDDQPYVVMAYVDGETLEGVLSRGRIEDLECAVDFAAQVADALGAIHQHGIIHRDLKPGNILIDQNGKALLTDFGLAVSTVGVERLTSDGLIVGTPVYMSPEQAGGENSTLTSASDIYSLGAVLFEMVAGTVPFRAPLLELLRRIKSEQPPSLISLRPDVDVEISEIVNRAMAKSPDERFQSAAQLSGALRNWLTAHRSTSVAAGANLLGTELPLKTTVKRRWPSIISWSVVGIGIACFATWQYSRKDFQASATSSSAVTNPLVSQAGTSDSTPTRPLTGEFAIIVSSADDPFGSRKRRINLEEQSPLPLRNGELVKFEIQLNQPAHVYLLWVSPDSSVTPIYPWDSEHFEGFDAPLLPAGDRLVQQVTSPRANREGFEAVEPVGLQTFVMLARREPLAKSIDLARILANLPLGPKIDTQIAAIRPRLRGIKTGQTKSSESALYEELENRLSPHFDLVKIMTFPQVAK
jgi:serine/threonine protein kinase